MSDDAEAKIWAALEARITEANDLSRYGLVGIGALCAFMLTRSGPTLCLVAGLGVLLCVAIYARQVSTGAQIATIHDYLRRVTPSNDPSLSGYSSFLKEQTERSSGRRKLALKLNELALAWMWVVAALAILALAAIRALAR